MVSLTWHWWLWHCLSWCWSMLHWLPRHNAASIGAALAYLMLAHFLTAAFNSVVFAVTLYSEQMLYFMPSLCIVSTEVGSDHSDDDDETLGSVTAQNVRWSHHEQRSWSTLLDKDCQPTSAFISLRLPASVLLESNMCVIAVNVTECLIILIITAGESDVSCEIWCRSGGRLGFYCDRK